ncbi:MAG: Holliday junction resolvase RuvX [Longimicrobiales bacterium]
MDRILGIDFGSRRVGLALSDPTATIAQPLPTLKRRIGKRPPVAAIASLALEQQVSEIVIGLPLTLEGEESEWSAEVRAFGAKLAERTSVTVAFIDERMTSVVAERTVRSLGLKRSERERKERVDATAAVLILQAYLDRRPRG